MLLLSYVKKLLTSIAVFIFVYTVYSLQLGDGTSINSYVPKMIMKDVKQVITNDVYTVVLTKDLKVFATGYYSNSIPYVDGVLDGADSFIKIAENVDTIYNGVYLRYVDKTLGLPISKSLSFKNISFDKHINNVIYFDKNNYLMLLIDAYNNLWIKGREVKSVKESKYGNTYEYSSETNGFKKIDNNVIFAYSSNNMLIYLKKDGTVWARGDNSTRKLKNCDEKIFLESRKIAEDIDKCFIKEYVYFIDKYKNLIKIENGNHITIDTDVKSISDFFYIKNDDSLFAYGFGCYGSLGVGKTDEVNVPPTFVMSNVKKAIGTEFHSLILTNDYKLYACGGGHCNFGANGNGSKERLDYPILIMEDVKDFSISNYHSMVIKNDDTLWGFGLNNINEQELYY
ncbi:hypothetical protein SAMN04487977_1202 [Treponema bryantii]|uniref:Alpha-tubulin suppressor n=1 Tax=Treponema bryantii TaxID=163 RepID=A0A1H9K0Q9_9SPIR|nr:hypothetical protein [Treponema bryantii]SEQ92674.1 hypothetical protein SAMN04487977_1202 [Treponema bryantii]